MIRNSTRQFVSGVAVVSLFALMVGSPSVASAIPIVDQSFVGIHNLAANINEGFDLAGQSFTAGVTGNLVGVRVDILSSKSSSLRISIYDMLGSTPHNLLETTSLATAQSLIGDTIALPAPLSIVAGSKYLIAADYPGIPRGPGQNQGNWAGAPDDLYLNGNAFAGKFVSGDSGPVDWLSQTFDLHFQTLVNPVPEPATLILCAAGFVSLGVFGRGKKVRTFCSRSMTTSAVV